MYTTARAVRASPRFFTAAHQVPRTKRYPQAPLVQVRLPLPIVPHAPQLTLSVCTFRITLPLDAIAVVR